MFLDVGACSKKEAMEASVSISVIRLLRKLHSSMMKSIGLCLARPLTTVWAVLHHPHIKSTAGSKDDLAVEVVGAFAPRKRLA